MEYLIPSLIAGAGGGKVASGGVGDGVITALVGVIRSMIVT
ncbi:hypothetical protein [Maritimibacter sp. HL-12]|jgi:hypothetical protein|nr:hypothetical protein [Maritimibacter sp. HL-12]SMH40994.1 hypothetical protein SAMN05661107_1186 [Maritimibacter sp. HL-12]